MKGRTNASMKRGWLLLAFTASTACGSSGGSSDCSSSATKDTNGASASDAGDPSDAPAGDAHDASTVVAHDAGTETSSQDASTPPLDPSAVRGRCEYAQEAPGIDPYYFCWDFDYAVDLHGGTFTEHDFYYDEMNAPVGQDTCANDDGRSTGMQVPPSADAIAAARAVLAQKQADCDLAFGTFTVGEQGCSSVGSTGHCTETGTMSYDAPSSTLSTTRSTTWSRP